MKRAPLPTILLGLSPCMLALGAALVAYDVPGLYMDGVNPDYLVARLFAPIASHVQSWTLAGNMMFGLFPVIQNIYYGSLPFWLGLPFYGLFGTDVLGVRLANAAFSIMLIGSAWWMLRAMKVNRVIAALVLSVMAVDPAFHFIFRTQFYMQAVPCIFLFGSIALIWPAFEGEAVSNRRKILSGVGAGIAAYGYFIHVFYAATVGAAILLKRPGAVPRWMLGALIGFAPTLLGILSFVLTQGVDGALQMLTSLEVSKPETLSQRFSYFYTFAPLALSGDGVSHMILQVSAEFQFTLLRNLVLIGLPAVVLLLTELLRRPVPALRLMAALLVLPPIGFGIMFGSRLWIHHFAATVPIAYCCLAIAVARMPRLLQYAAAIATLGLAAINVANFAAFVERIEATGGVGPMSDAITRFSRQARGDDRTYYQIPDWGLVMQFSMITSGGPEAAGIFAPNILRERLCAGQDVVVVSNGIGAEQRAKERVAAIDWPAEETAITYERSGKPLIYATRWKAVVAGDAGSDAARTAALQAARSRCANR